LSSSQTSTRPSGNQFHRTWTHDKIVERIHAWQLEHGTPPTKTDWDPWRSEKEIERVRAKLQQWVHRNRLITAGEWPNSSTVIAEFGSWNAALAAAGIEPRPQGRTPRELTDRQVADLRRRAGGMAAGPSQLAVSIKRVMEARAAKDRDALRSALYDLAATTMAWLDRLDEPEASRVAA
jgi:hypothetical protein